MRSVPAFTPAEARTYSVLKKQILEHKMSPKNIRKSETKIAIVTGGSRGLGRNTVLGLAKRGDNSIFTYNSNQAEAEKVTCLAAQAGRKAIALQLDTGNLAAFDCFVQSVRTALAELGNALRLSRQQSQNVTSQRLREDDRGRTGLPL